MAVEEAMNKTPFTTIIREEDLDIPWKTSPVYRAQIPVLGCTGWGFTPEEAMKELEQVKLWWIRTQLDNGCILPD